MIKWNDELLGKQVTPAPGWIVTDGRRYGKLYEDKLISGGFGLYANWSDGDWGVVYEDAHSPVYPPNGWGDTDEVWGAVAKGRVYESREQVIWLMMSLDAQGLKVAVDHCGDIGICIKNVPPDDWNESWTWTYITHPSQTACDQDALITALQNAHMLADHIAEGRDG